MSRRLMAAPLIEKGQAVQKYFSHDCRCRSQPRVVYAIKELQNCTNRSSNGKNMWLKCWNNQMVVMQSNASC